MKASILKAIHWNDKSYRGPAGLPATSGYPFEHGYGHEEWNNSPEMIWQGFRVFHTESTEALVKYSRTGELGMLMFIARGGKKRAVGVAAGVLDNSDDAEKIATDLRLYDRWTELWKLPVCAGAFPKTNQRSCFNGRETSELCGGEQCRPYTIGLRSRSNSTLAK